MPSVGTLRDAIEQRLSRGESQRAIATALGVSPRTIRRVLSQPEEVPDEEEDAEDDAPEEEDAPTLEPVTPAAALEWLQAYAERIAEQARTAYAPWHVLQVTQELSLLMVAVVKEVRAHAHD